MSIRDVVVVGGGPAGSAVATHLARQSWDVLLLDRSVFPRDKPCGEFLTPGTKPLLTNLGVWPHLFQLGLREVASAKLHAPGGSQAVYTPADEPAGYALRRTLLDEALLENAQKSGVEVREGVSVRDLILEDGTVHGVRIGNADSAQDIRARLVMGADGTHSLVARKLGVVRPISRLQRIALVSHWRGVEADSIEMRAQGSVVCGLGALSDNSANVTLVVPSSEAPSIAQGAGEYLERRIRDSFPDLAKQLVGAEREETLRTVGCFGHRCSRVFKAGAMLVGDAAAFVDPFTGEGIYFALEGARLAAEAADAALQEGDLSAYRLSAYDRTRAELRRRYLLCDVVQGVVRSPQMYGRVIRRLYRRGELTEQLMGVLGDVRPPSDALNAAFLWRLFAPR